MSVVAGFFPFGRFRPAGDALRTDLRGSEIVTLGATNFCRNGPPTQGYMNIFLYI